ncbi:MAG: N-acetyltransferase [Phycisphaerales bacterium]
MVVRPVDSWLDRRRFQRLPWAIYDPPGSRRDPNWVPPILAQERELLGWRNWRGGRHPFYDNAEGVTLIAERGGRTVGRVGALVNHVHNAKYDERLGFFGFFECVNDAAVARALFAAGEAWLRQRGMTAVRGPVNPSLNYTCGLLVDGFDRPPCFLMTYNPPYYGALLEACGFAKSQDLYAYEMDLPLLAKLVERYKPAVLSALERTDLVIRPMDARRFRQEIETYLDIYNRSLDGTWGFTPLQPREAGQIAREMRHVIVPEFAIFAEIDSKPIGALLALLDYNQIFRTLNGRLFPLGFLRLLGGRRRITRARAMAMTMVPGYQSAGLSVVLLDHLVRAAAGTQGAAAAQEVRKPAWPIDRYEFSWVLESNARSRGTIERTGAKRTNTYRIYDKAL